MIVIQQQNGALEEVRIVVDGEIAPKGRPRVVNNHAYTPERTRVSESRIVLAYRSVYRGSMFDVGVPLRMVVDVFLRIPKSAGKTRREQMIAGEIRPVGRVGDLDNFEKTVADALNGVAYPDDSQIVEMVGRKMYSAEPRVEIYIARIGEPDAE